MKRLLAALFAFAALASLPGCARAQTLVSLQVLDLERQETLPQYPHRGRDYIEGRAGHRYAVVLQNLTGERVLAVVSVDGVNAISGQTAGAQQTGYVLGPWQRLEVRGWRKNLSEIAEFHFTSLDDSYAARTGRPQNVGVIGVAAFRERRPMPAPHYPAPWQDRSERSGPYPSAAAPMAKAESRGGATADAASADYERGLGESAARQQLGTGHGQRRWDAATATSFERESPRPNQQLSVWYDSTRALVARGILPARWPHDYGEPTAFPIGFVPDPY
ncbi:hypothetical protein [Arenimonas sp. MALMAid1274]|uniref:hypothetical protein n=1 Tax=Arenimonas sp. MALMAid1274 TaxID=3411630 RepID=UPI003BA3CDD2